MEVIRQEGPTKVEKQIEDEEEILPDGTIHHIHKERSSSFKSVQKCVATEDGQVKVVEETKEEIPGSLKENILETFKGPVQCVHEEQEIDEVLEDGKKVHKHVVLNRLQCHIHTHQESFDSQHGHREEDEDMDEVVPGTESAFVVNDDDDNSSSTSEDIEDGAVGSSH